MYRSVLARCRSRDAGAEIHASYQPNAPIPPSLVFDYLEDLSTDRFINVSVAVVGAQDIRCWRLPATNRALLAWGTGAYRADVVMLACLPLDRNAPALNDIRYFTGTRDGAPVWSPAGLQHEPRPFLCSTRPRLASCRSGGTRCCGDGCSCIATGRKTRQACR